MNKKYFGALICGLCVAVLNTHAYAFDFEAIKEAVFDAEDCANLLEAAGELGDVNCGEDHFRFVWGQDGYRYPQLSKEYLTEITALNFISLDDSFQLYQAIEVTNINSASNYFLAAGSDNYEHVAFICIQKTPNEINVYYLDGLGGEMGFDSRLIELLISHAELSPYSINYFRFKEPRQYCAGICGAYAIFDYESFLKHGIKHENIMRDRHRPHIGFSGYVIAPQMPYFSWCQSNSRYQIYFGERDNLENKLSPIREAITHVLQILGQD